MRVAVSLPCLRNRWFLFAFGILGKGNTCGFLHPPCTSHRSRRLFLERVLRAGNEPLPNDQTGISIGISAHLTLLTEAKRRARGISLDGLPLGIANDQAMATSTFSGRMARVDAGSQDTQVPRLVFGEVEDPPLHPEGTLAIPPVAILPFFRFEVPQVLEDQDTSPLLLGELDNASAHQMSTLLICVADFVPEGGIVLFVLGNDASLGSVACNPSQLSLPKAGYLSATADEAGGQDRTFDRLDSAYCEMFVEVQIDRTDSRCGIGGDLCLNLWGALEVLLHRGMQPPLLPRRTSEGLPAWASLGSSRPVRRTLSQLQQLPVQTLSRMDEEVRPFHWPK